MNPPPLTRFNLRNRCAAFLQFTEFVTKEQTLSLRIYNLPSVLMSPFGRLRFALHCVFASPSVMSYALNYFVKRLVERLSKHIFLQEIP
jgi:hypothetical protein